MAKDAPVDDEDDKMASEDENSESESDEEVETLWNHIALGSTAPVIKTS